ncbi:MAG: hypothetical protein PHR83_07090 [Paludibacter sp.]|nr:hypothetical protein [Paludibacter sp.]
MSTADFIPRSDSEFNLWQGTLVEYVALNLVAWGIPEPDFAAVKSKQNAWITAYAKASNKQNRTSVDVVAKDDAHTDYVTSIRPFVAEWLASNSKVTDSDRTLMGLTVKSGTHTPVAKPTTIPVASIDFSVRKQHTINFHDETSSRSKAKPEGVHGCEIYTKVDGDPPKDVSEMNYVGICTATPYTILFDGAKVGKIVYYWLRWINTRGECGPWSTPVSAIVVG